MNRINTTALIAGLAALFLCASWSQVVAHAAQDFETFRIGGGDEPAPFQTIGIGWVSTSLGSSALGAPANVTWSIVPDGTNLPGNLIPSGQPNTPSDLIQFLDGIHHGGTGPGGTDLTQRAWYSLYESAFERWDRLSGISFNYEPKDDGRTLGSSSGATGVRGDHRIGGHSIDGQTSPTFLAFNFFPNNSDMVIDTDEINRWGNSTNNFRLFRNMTMHEIGHGIGLNHVESFDVNPNQSKFQFGTFLMEPILSGLYDGPQLDDILGAHRLYGDVNEEGSGNDTSLNATMLGSIQSGQSVSIGTDATDTFVSPGDTDFVSIDDNSDVDYFKFSITGRQTIDLTLTPLGPTYDEGPQGSGNSGTQQPFVSSAQSDLTLTLVDIDGISLREFSNDNGIGLHEVISNHQLSVAGEYFVRVGGLSNAAQFFQLDITAVPEPTSLLLMIIGTISCVLKRRR